LPADETEEQYLASLADDYADYAEAMEGMDAEVGSDQELSGLSLSRQQGQQQEQGIAAV
jgi:hypothetical protein